MERRRTWEEEEGGEGVRAGVRLSSAVCSWEGCGDTIALGEGGARARGLFPGVRAAGMVDAHQGPYGGAALYEDGRAAVWDPDGPPHARTVSFAFDPECVVRLPCGGVAAGGVAGLEAVEGGAAEPVLLLEGRHVVCLDARAGVVVAGTADGRAAVCVRGAGGGWRAGRPVAVTSHKTPRLTCVRLAPDAARVAVAGWAGGVTVHAVDAGGAAVGAALVRPREDSAEADASSHGVHAAWDEGGALLAFTEADAGGVRVWSARDGTAGRAVRLAKGWAARGVAAARGGAFVVAAAEQRTRRLAVVRVRWGDVAAGPEPLDAAGRVLCGAADLGGALDVAGCRVQVPFAGARALRGGDAALGPRRVVEAHGRPVAAALEGGGVLLALGEAAFVSVPRWTLRVLPRPAVACAPAEARGRAAVASADGSTWLVGAGGPPEAVAGALFPEPHMLVAAVSADARAVLALDSSDDGDARTTAAAVRAAGRQGTARGRVGAPWHAVASGRGPQLARHAGGGWLASAPGGTGAVELKEEDV